MKIKTIPLKFDFVVCGAGMSGICAAIQASRAGLKTALINSRGFLGGNASPEIRIHVCGATGASEFNLYSREGGVIGELLIENRHRNPQGNVYLWHTVLLDALKREENCSIFLNTYIDEVNVEDHSILSVEGTQSSTEKRYCFYGDTFLDDTGDGTIGYLAGAEVMYGREAKSKWNEKIAPEEFDKGVLLSSLSFYTKDFHKKMKFELPEYSKNLHEKFQDALKFREIPDRIPEDARYDGYRFQWYYETGGQYNQIHDCEEINQEHQDLINNIWDYIKNQSEYVADPFDFEYISPVLGKRESRRLVGEYILKEQDIAEQRDFEDAIAYGGWSIDLHAKGGFFDNDLINRHYYLRGVYQIPFRCCCVKDVNNLMVASRCLSVSHVASGTTRIMSTLALLGQACASAAAIGKRYGVLPKEVGTRYIEELQEELQRLDQGIPGKKKRNKILEESELTASSTFQGKLNHTDKWMTLQDTVGFIMPVSKKNKVVSIFMKANQDTSFHYAIYKPEKIENYGPEVLLKEDTIQIKKSTQLQEIKLDLNDLCYEYNIFIYLYENENICIELSQEKINGVQLLKREISPRNTYYDIQTYEPKQYLFVRMDGIPVFDYKTDIYSVDNIKNGYIRNYGHPNLWMSEDTDSSPELVISFKQETEVSQISITFDNLCDDFDYDTLETLYESNVWEQIVKDYDIYGMVHDEWILLASERNVYQRVQHTNIPLNAYKKMKLKLLETNGSPRFSIYDISLS